MKTLLRLVAPFSFGASFAAPAQAPLAGVSSLDAARYAPQAEQRFAAKPQGPHSAWAVYSTRITLRSGSFLKSAKDNSCGRAS
jgi:hypothetical protein